jgi:hypothetical protein
VVSLTQSPISQTTNQSKKAATPTNPPNTIPPSLTIAASPANVVGVITAELVTVTPFDVNVVGTVVGFRGGGTTLPLLVVVYSEVGSETGLVHTSSVQGVVVAVVYSDVGSLTGLVQTSSVQGMVVDWTTPVRIWGIAVAKAAAAGRRMKDFMLAVWWWRIW